MPLSNLFKRSAKEKQAEFRRQKMERLKKAREKRLVLISQRSEQEMPLTRQIDCRGSKLPQPKRVYLIRKRELNARLKASKQGAR